MPSVSVLGLGNWGTALANHLARKGVDVLGWSIEPEVVAGVNSDNKNPTYLGDVTLDSRLRATGVLEEALEHEKIVMVIPSVALAEVVPKLTVKPETLIISAIKGLEKKSLQTPLTYAKAHLPSPARLAVISGPSFAKEVVAGYPCGVVAAAENESDAIAAAELFDSEAMKVYVSTDPLGVELGGILKNVVALAAGMSDGLKLGESARAGLITRGLAEMMRLAEAMGADPRTLAGLSGLGDLTMTATSPLSRNRTVGMRLGEGESLEHIIETLGSVAEGVSSTPCVLALAEKYGVDLPIATAVSRVLNEEIQPQEMVRGLLSRPMKREFE